MKMSKDLKKERKTQISKVKKKKKIVVEEVGISSKINKLYLEV